MTQLLHAEMHESCVALNHRTFMKTLRCISLILWLTLIGFASGGCASILDTAVGTGINCIGGRNQESSYDQLWREYDENR